MMQSVLIQRKGIGLPALPSSRSFAIQVLAASSVSQITTVVRGIIVNRAALPVLATEFPISSAVGERQQTSETSDFHDNHLVHKVLACRPVE